MALMTRRKHWGGFALAALLVAAVASCTTPKGPPPDPGGAVVIGRDSDGQMRTLLLTPVDGGVLTSRFGPRKHPLSGGMRRHLGTDYGAPKGSPIRAAGAGVVASVGPRGAYGNYVLIRHDYTYATGYAHMSGFANGLSNGRKVRQGEVIGYVGSTGRSTGAHLHYEVYEDGERIDPYGMQALNEGSTGEGYFAEDSAGGTVALKTGDSETANGGNLSFFETANQTIAIAGDTLAVATESVIAMAEDLARSDAGRQLTAWGGQARDAFEKEVLTPLDLEKLFDGFGEEAADVSAD